MHLPCQKNFFCIPRGVAYLNCAGMSPLLKDVRQAGINAISKRSEPWKYSIDDWFKPAETLRQLFAEIIKASPQNIALIPSVSYGLAIAARNILLTDKQNIVLLHQQFPSNVYVWRELSKQSGSKIITVQREENQTWADAIIAKIDAATGLVAVENCHWADGSFVDLEKVSTAAKLVGAKLVVDASQAAGACPININQINPDFLVTVGYKWLLGPYGLSYLYVADTYCKTGTPIEFPWLNKIRSEDFAVIDYEDKYRSGARRFDAGSFPAFINIPMGIVALTQIIQWGVENIQETISVLTNKIEMMAKATGFKTIDQKLRGVHITAIDVSDIDASLVNEKLIHHNIYVSHINNGIRVSPHLYNDKNDLLRLFDVLKNQ